MIRQSVSQWGNNIIIKFRNFFEYIVNGSDWIILDSGWKVNSASQVIGGQ